jgi:hypothetical protein
MIEPENLGVILAGEPQFNANCLRLCTTNSASHQLAIFQQLEIQIGTELISGSLRGTHRAEESAVDIGAKHGCLLG